MAVRIVGNDARGLTLEAPVSANSNHLRTAFGGSINAIATLAGYALLWLELGENSAVHLVVVESSIRFLRPIRETIRATCLRPSEQEQRAFLAEVARGKRARIRLRVVVEEEGVAAAEFFGTFAELSGGGPVTVASG